MVDATLGCILKYKEDIEKIQEDGIPKVIEKARMLRERLAKLSMVDLRKIPTDKVSYGSIVTLQDLDENKEITYHLVSSEESDVSKGMISTVSPIGKSLMGHKEGDEVNFKCS